MPHLSRRAIIAIAIAGSVGVAVPMTLAATTSSAQPADKAVAAGSTIQDLQPSSSGTPILTATLKTSKPEDLLLDVSLECSIITDVTAQGSPTPGSTSTGEASGAIRVWLTLDSPSNIIPIQDASSPPQNPGPFGNDSDKVTFCDRDHQVSVTDAENAPDGTDTLHEYLRTKSANAFNWVRLNTGSGTHTVTLWAEFDSPSHDSLAANTDGSTSTGFVGNRTLVIEPTKLANNAVISDAGTN